MLGLLEYGLGDVVECAIVQESKGPSMSTRTVDLATACSEIKQACDDAEAAPGSSPFFFLTGAGVSVPSIPLSSEIVAHCREKAASLGRTADPGEPGPMSEYSRWFKAAYRHSKQRQRYLQSIIKDKRISAANLRLAHLLLSGSISRLVVTPNFDDQLTRALDLFGHQYVLCDHPQTAARISPDNKDDVQVVHAHGTHWFYDCCNLDSEIEKRSSPSVASTATMAALLDDILRSRSPIVVGYAGWEKDVIMTALRRRLTTPLPYCIYWCCFQREQIDGLPQFLREADDVCFVVLPTRPTERASPSESTGRAQASGLPTDRARDALTAEAVFDSLIRVFNSAPPRLITEPLEFLADRLGNSLDTAATTEDDIYGIRRVIDRITKAVGYPEYKRQEGGGGFSRVRDYLLGSRYREAIAEAAHLNPRKLQPAECREVASAMWKAATALLDNSPDELQAYDLVVEHIDASGMTDAAARVLSARALRNKGVTLDQANRHEDALTVYDEVLKRHGEAPEPELREQVAQALVNRGVTFGQLGRSEEAVGAYDEVVGRFGDAVEPELRVQVAMALVNKGIALGQCGRHEDALAAHAEVAKRYGEAVEPELRRQVAMALFNKGVTLGEIDRHEDEVAAYDEVLKRFGEAVEPQLREQVAKTLVNKGVTLGQLSRNEDAVAVYDEVIKEFGEAVEPQLRVLVAMALVNKGITLGGVDRHEDEVAAYGEVVTRFGEAAEPQLREQVAKALVNKGFTFGQLNRSEDEVAAYDELLKRFGEAAESGLRKQVAKAHWFKACVLAKTGNTDAAFSELSRAIDADFSIAPRIVADEDLVPLRGDKRWQDILSRSSDAKQ